MEYPAPPTSFQQSASGSPGQHRRCRTSDGRDWGLEGMWQESWEGLRLNGKWKISHFHWDALCVALNLNSYPCIFEVIIERNAILICRVYLNLIYENIINMALPWQLHIFHNGPASPSFHFISFCLHNIAWALSESSQDSDANRSFITKHREIALLWGRFMKDNHCACLGPELKWHNIYFIYFYNKKLFF